MALPISSVKMNGSSLNDLYEYLYVQVQEGINNYLN